MVFAIGEDAHAESVEEQDRTDSANLYKVLTEQVIPLFYQRDAQGIPGNGFKKSGGRWPRLCRSSPRCAWSGIMPRSII